MAMHVRWRHHEYGLLGYLRHMLASEAFVDVTICCQNKTLRAHRVLLSASSPYLKELLLAHPATDHTTIILDDIEYEDMRLLLDFIYTGGAAVPEERLNTFLKAADTLQVSVLKDRATTSLIGREFNWSPLASVMTAEESNRPIPCLVPIRPQLGIVTPSPWAQSARPPVGPPRRRTHSPCQEPMNLHSPSSIKDHQELPTAMEEKCLDLVKTEAPMERITSNSNNNNSSKNCIKLCKLKERRLQEFYREQEKLKMKLENEPNDLRVQQPDVEIKHESPNPLQSIAAGDERPELNHIYSNNDNNNNNENGEDEKPFLCKTCGKQFPDQDHWSSHMKIHDASKPEHTCTHCNKVFVTRASLKVHMRTHTGEKPFQCLECGKQFSQLRNYKYHRSVHEGTREFAATCPECGKYFNDRGYLSSHMKIHRNRKEYGCEYCGKSFNQRVAYNMHVRIHTGEKPHSCPHCGKSFSRKMLLKQHLRIHTGEKPFSCVVCQKAFADRSNMTLHMRLHSGIKPYSCTVCSKSFTKKHHLKTHMNYHTGVKPYTCEKCGLKFSQSSNMRTHFKKCNSNCSPTTPTEIPSTSPLVSSYNSRFSFNAVPQSDGVGSHHLGVKS